MQERKRQAYCQRVDAGRDGQNYDRRMPLVMSSDDWAPSSPETDSRSMCTPTPPSSTSATQ